MSDISFLDILTICVDFIFANLATILIVFGFEGYPFGKEIQNIPEILLISRILCIIGILVILVLLMHIVAVSLQCSSVLFLITLFLLFMYVIEMAVIGTVYVGGKPFRMYTDYSIRRWMKDYDKYNETKYIIDTMNKQLSCCGIESPSDWDVKQMPLTCCDDIFALPANETSCPQWMAHQLGCRDAVLTWISEGMYKRIWVFVAATVVQVIYALLVIYDWFAMTSDI